MITMPHEQAVIRAEICARCPAPCSHQADSNFHAQRCAACPAHHWGTYGSCRDDQSGIAQPPTKRALLTIPDPPLSALAGRVAYAAWRAANAGIHGDRVFVTDAEYEARSAICEPCEYWDGKARFGFGKCKAPKCGCTKFKRWLATERCKHPAGDRWPT
jgi:hypothetical protein